ncbi:hypothetical protein [uncultured Flavobacterium sp.]|uniref:hypothetical protein n=1 Tax=uncultured Flavobacterium sp. TaxID=165435 RepID=UPI0030821C9E
MKQTFCMFLLILILLGCNRNSKKKVYHAPISANKDTIIKLSKLQKLFVIGDFDGNGKQDTLFQHNFSKKTQTEIEKSPDVFQNDWDNVVKWFYNQDSDLYLTTNQNNSDTLHLGEAQGLYCLINIGDNNGDNKDEIALVIDKLDFSRVNNCEIYSLCNEKWTELKHFGIHEGSFDFNTEKVPVFSKITDFLENQNGKWVYRDYLQDTYENEEQVGKMKRLKLEKCN